MTIHITFIMRDGTQRMLDAKAEETILELSRRFKIKEIEGACGGAMACSTCHVIIDPKWYEKLPAPSLDETDMLDLAPGITKTSRLGCQIVIKPDMDGLIIKLPQTTFSQLG